MPIQQNQLTGEYEHVSANGTRTSVPDHIARMVAQLEQAVPSVPPIGGPGMEAPGGVMPWQLEGVAQGAELLENLGIRDIPPEEQLWVDKMRADYPYQTGTSGLIYDSLPMPGGPILSRLLDVGVGVATREPGTSPIAAAIGAAGGGELGRHAGWMGRKLKNVARSAANAARRFIRPEAAALSKRGYQFTPGMESGSPLLKKQEIYLSSRQGGANLIGAIAENNKMKFNQDLARASGIDPGDMPNGVFDEAARDEAFRQAGGRFNAVADEIGLVEVSGDRAEWLRQSIKDAGLWDMMTGNSMRDGIETGMRGLDLEGDTITMTARDLMEVRSVLNQTRRKAGEQIAGGNLKLAGKVKTQMANAKSAIRMIDDTIGQQVPEELMPQWSRVRDQWRFLETIDKPTIIKPGGVDPATSSGIRTRLYGYESNLPEVNAFKETVDLVNVPEIKAEMNWSNTAAGMEGGNPMNALDPQQQAVGWYARQYMKRPGIGAGAIAAFDSAGKPGAGSAAARAFGRSAGGTAGDIIDDEED